MKLYCQNFFVFVQEFCSNSSKYCHCEQRPSKKAEHTCKVNTTSMWTPRGHVIVLTKQALGISIMGIYS